jgi:hypothetical protein
VGGDREGDAGAGVGVRFVLCTNAHLSDDEAVAKMGAPGFVAIWAAVAQRAKCGGSSLRSE